MRYSLISKFLNLFILVLKDLRIFILILKLLKDNYLVTTVAFAANYE